MAKGIPGAQLYTVREFTQTIEDVAETLKKVARIGYTAIQISAFGPVDPKEVARIARVTREAELHRDVHALFARLQQLLEAPPTQVS